MRSALFSFVTKQTDRQTDRRTELVNYDFQNRASIAVSRGKNLCLILIFKNRIDIRKNAV